MIQIDMQRIRDGLPSRAIVHLKKKNSTVFIECIVRWPGLYNKGTKEEEQTVEMVKDWQRQIVGEALSEFYTEETGSHWMIYLKRIPMEFINTTDEDIKNYSGVDVSKFKPN